MTAIEDLKIVQLEIERDYSKKSRVIPLSLIFFAWFGLHRFYLDDAKIGIAYISLTIITILCGMLGFTGLSLVLFGFMFIIPIIDFFIILRKLNRERKELEQRKIIALKNKVKNFEEVESSMERKTKVEIALMEFDLKNKMKDKTIGSVLWYFTGWFGGHAFFLGNIKKGVIFLFIGFLIQIYNMMKESGGVNDYLNLFGSLVLLVVVISYFVVYLRDAFTLDEKMETHNKEVINKKIELLTKKKKEA